MAARRRRRRTIVDTGYDIDSTREAWDAILARRPAGDAASSSPTTIPDHPGLAQWLSERSGARWHDPRGIPAGHAVWNGPPGYNETDMVAQFRRNGLDAAARRRFMTAATPFTARGVPRPPSYRRCMTTTDSHRRARVAVIVGRGHSPSTLAVLRGGRRTDSGDMLLPRISTNGAFSRSAG